MTTTQTTKQSKATAIETEIAPGVPRCQGIKRDGTQCNRYTAAYSGTGSPERYCLLHAGLAK